ncbi:MAG: ChbG/HpnK family deacetylase [Turicibacter sp.]|nr:ChbG/HpnK family deacetylase [Turicibacter sp.]
MKSILFRADDLGYSEAVNYGIEKAVKEGLVRNVGVMMNMAATEHGVSLMKDVTHASFGQHTNVSAGFPITDPSLIPSLVQVNGQFKGSKQYSQAEGDSVVFEEALLEIRAQYDAFVRLFGRKPDYIDGHAIASQHFFQAIAHVAKEKGVKSFSFAMKEGVAKPVTMIGDTELYTNMDFMAEDYEPMMSFEQIMADCPADQMAMMVLHPGYLDDYILSHSSLLIPRTKEVVMITSEEVADFIKEHEIKVVDIRDL